jgi:hypothetical protein
MCTLGGSRREKQKRRRRRSRRRRRDEDRAVDQKQLGLQVLTLTTY